MPTTVTSYQCNLCGNDYPTRAEAERCESNGFPPLPNFKTGDEITFENERVVGSRWAYRSQTGVIKNAFLDVTDTGDRHVWVLSVNPDVETVGPCLVLKDDEGRWISPAEYSGIEYTGPDMLERARRELES